MAEQTEERVNHYEEMMKMAGQFTGLEGLARHTLSDDLEKRVDARRIGIEMFDSPSTISDDEIRTNVFGKAQIERDVALEYFGAHRDEVLAGIDGSKLEKAVYDYLPQLGFAPNTKAKGRAGQIAKKHEAYLGARQLFEKVRGGDLGELEIEALTEAAIEEAIIESQEYLKGRGLDPKKHAKSYSLAKISADNMVRRAKNKTQIILKYTGKAAERAKAEFDAEFNEEYTREQYAREMISSVAKENTLGALRGIYQLHETKFKD